MCFATKVARNELRRLGIKMIGRARTVFAARVAGVDVVRRATPARVLPVKAQTPKRVRRRPMTRGGEIQPNPFPDDLGQLELLRQLLPQTVQNCLRGKLAVRVVLGVRPLRAAGFWKPTMAGHSPVLPLHF